MICTVCQIDKLKEEFEERKPGLYRKVCKSCRHDQQKAWYERNKEKRSQYKKQRLALPEIRAAANKNSNKYAKTDRRKKYTKAYRANKYQNDVNWRLAARLRSRLANMVKSGHISGFATKYLGCTLWELKLHLEKHFYMNAETGEMMTWDNYGRTGWHIDHVYPLTKGDLTDVTFLKKVCHYSNLRPLWYKDNIRKSNKTS